mmetsp:Transcript_488/g.926  ORF Transcript_488/g.926 Transcript_488/m.926 type:complete len:203 (-) Transcript_488:1164-1772(-)
MRNLDCKLFHSCFFVANSSYERSVQGHKVQHGSFTDPSLPLQRFSRVPIDAKSSNKVVTCMILSPFPILAKLPASQRFREGPSNPQGALVVVQLKIAGVVATVRAFDLPFNVRAYLGSNDGIDPWDPTHLLILSSCLVEVSTLLENLDGLPQLSDVRPSQVISNRTPYILWLDCVLENYLRDLSVCGYILHGIPPRLTAFRI